MAITKSTLNSLATEYLELEKTVKYMTDRMKKIKAIIKTHAKEGEMVLPKARIIYTVFHVRVFNEKRFKEENPELFPSYVEERERSRLEIKI